jgi:hypothetical protein
MRREAMGIREWEGKGKERIGSALWKGVRREIVVER